MSSTSPGSDHRTEFDALRPDAMLRINQACDAFEKHWNHREGEVNLDDFLEQIKFEQTFKDTNEIRALAIELVTLDIQYRQQRSLSFPIDAYCSRFPDLQHQWLLNLIEQTRGKSDLRFAKLEPNQRLGDYIIRRSIGDGGMGQLYEAEHALMGRKVAIKVLAKKLQHDPIAQRRFEREVRSISKLAHPSILTAFDARREHGTLYLVTEWIDGHDLSQFIAANGPLAIADAIDCVLQAIAGLQYAHEQGVIHRDVKPSNLLIDNDGNVKVLDLGLAKVVWEAPDDEVLSDVLTKSTEILGTAAFLSPEQARNPLAVDPRSDIYSLGCTFYYLLTGKPPYSAKSRVDMVVGHLSAPIPKLSDLVPDAPPQLVLLIRSMLAKSPDDRPDSMAAVGVALRVIRDELEQTPQTSNSLTELDEPPPPSRRHATPIGRRLILGVALAIPGFMLIEFGRQIWLHLADAGRGWGSLASGVVMNGRTSYGQVEDFAMELSGPTMLEAWVTPTEGVRPSNIISWTGRDALILFISAQAEWGVALLRNGQPELRVTLEKIDWDRNQLVAGVWEEPQLRLFIDGREVATKPMQYNFQPKRTSLCFGGLPDDLFPIEHGTRFFQGLISAIRISTGNDLQPASTPAEMVEANDSTFALFPFHEGEGAVAHDSSRNGWKARLVDAAWHSADHEDQ